MAKTITKLSNDNQGQRKVVYAQITLDNSYPTGGYPLKLDELGLVEVDHWSIEGEAVGAWGEYDYTNKKIKMFASNGTEVANAVNLSAIKLRCKFEGV